MDPTVGLGNVVYCQCTESTKTSHGCCLRAPAGLHDHVRDVHLNNDVLRVEVHHGERAPLDGHAAGRDRRVNAVGLQLAKDRGVEGRGDARRTRQVLRTLTHAVVHVVTLGRNDPVLPMYVSKLDVEVFLAADAGILATPQRALAQGVLGVVITLAHLGHQERLLGGVAECTLAAQVASVFLAVHL